MTLWGMLQLCQPTLECYLKHKFRVLSLVVVLWNRTALVTLFALSIAEATVRTKLVLLCGILAVLAAPAGAATTYEYDTLGRLSKASYDNGKQIVYAYDQAGNRTQVTTQATPPHAGLVKAKAKKTKKARIRHA